MQLLTSRLCGVNIKAIEIANDLNRDFELGGPVITMEGILTDDKAECQALFDRLCVEIDQSLEILESLGGVKLPRRTFKDREYKRAFDEAARRLYEIIADRPWVVISDMPMEQDGNMLSCLR